jgi:plasmid segregation protein ParM
MELTGLERKMSKVAHQRRELEQGSIYRVAIDDGLAQIKLVGEFPGGEVKALKFRNSVKPGAGGVLSMTGDALDQYVTEEGNTFSCSDSISGEESRFPGFHVSEIDRVLIRHALMRAGYSGLRVQLLTSLPVDEYYLAGARNQARIEAKMANLMKGVRQAGNAAADDPELEGVQVGCQAISAFFDYILDDDGNMIKDAPEAVAIVDIGGSTTDIAVILDGERIDAGASGAIRNGVLDVHAAVTAKLARQINEASLRLSPRVIDEACRSRQIKLHGEMREITTLVDDAIQEVGSTIVREIERRIGSGAALDRIIFTGGGAALFFEVLGRWRNNETLRDSEFANARGLLKFARSQG